MTSTTAGSSAGSSDKLLKEINELFSWNPPLLVPPENKNNKKLSTATRQPSFYDKHFASHLVLERVARLPSLVRDLAKNVDKALAAASGTLPPLDTFFTAAQRAQELPDLNAIARDEKAVATFYYQTTARYCVKVASTLALHPTASQWHGLLYWTSSGYAIMDGVLGFVEEANPLGKEQREAIVESMESKRRRCFEEMRNSALPLATWEIKSISTGTAEVMTAVSNLGKFSWTTCKAPDCLKNPKHEKAKKNAGDAVVGFDAQTPPWSFPDDSSSTSLVPEDRDKEIDIQPLVHHTNVPSAPQQRPFTRQAARSHAASGSSTLPPPPSGASRASEHRSPTKDKVKKRKLDEEADEAYQGHKEIIQPFARHTNVPSAPQRPPSTRQAARSSAASCPSTLPPPPSGASRASEHGSPKKDKGKKRTLDDEEDEAYKDRHDLTAQSLVQQAWAQAVRVDGTIIVLHSGNHELVCIRHRGTRTLYVSDLIEPPKCVNPGYGKLHVGIYIAAIQEAMDRHQRMLSQPKPPGDGGDLTGGDNDQDDQDHDRGSGSGREPGRGGGRGGGGGRGVSKRGGFQGSGEMKGYHDESIVVEETIHVTNHRDVLLLYLRYDIYDSPIPASFLRSAQSIMTHTRCPTPPFSPRVIRPCRLEECLSIVLTSEIGRGATGVAHRGTLKLEIWNGAMPLDVVVKLAFNDEQQDALRSEYEVYRCLRSKGVHRGIATALGLFDDSEGGARALVMLYAGVPLCEESQGNLSISDCNSALSTLESIHRAGILHGDVRRENILIGDLGVTIVDFGHSTRCNNQRAKDKEVARLRYLLGLPRKRMVTPGNTGEHENTAEA